MHTYITQAYTQTHAETHMHTNTQRPRCVHTHTHTYTLSLHLLTPFSSNFFVVLLSPKVPTPTPPTSSLFQSHCQFQQVDLAAGRWNPHPG